jgi:hypothetical protein
LKVRNLERKGEKERERGGGSEGEETKRGRTVKDGRGWKDDRVD